MTTILAEKLASTLAQVADTLLADPRGRLQLMAASDERARLLEAFQVQSQQGPCQDAFSRGALMEGCP